MAGHLVIGGLGPGADDDVTGATRRAVDEAKLVFLRTKVHPSAAIVDYAASFDDLYDQADTFDEVYQKIADRLIDAVDKHGDVLYLVPGSPLVLEKSVQIVRSQAGQRGISLTLLPALSFLDRVWTSLGIDPVETTTTLVDGHRFAEAAAGRTGPLLVAHTHARHVLSDVKLAANNPNIRVTVLQRLGLNDEAIFEVDWADLDRSFEPDHLTSLYIPYLTEPVAAELVGSVDLMNRLRADCPWDKKQTHKSLRKHLIEEAYEVLDAIDQVLVDPSGENYADLEEELGDLWFQILFHSILAQEQGQFSVADVARALNEKMVGRHPHVFASDVHHFDPTHWDELKAKQKPRASPFDGIPSALPSLAAATKVVRKGRRAGLPVPVSNATIVFGPNSAAIGRSLLLAVAYAADHGVDAELALREATLAATRRATSALTASDQSPDWLLG